MKVGIFDPYLDTLSGGEKYILGIAQCLSVENEVSIFWDKNLDEIEEKAEKKLGIDLKNVGFTKNIFSSTVKPLDRYLASRDFDLIIYLSDGSIPFVSSRLIVHFQFPVEWIKLSAKTKLKLTRVKKIICNSEFTKSFIDKEFGVRSEVLYPPVFIHGKQIKKENIILHVGRFGQSHEGVNFKKQDVMINAFKKICDKGIKEWKFVLIIGVIEKDRERFDILKKMVANYPIEIIENPSNNVLWDYYSKAKIYWHASGFGEDLEKHPEYAEHFGISTVEAMGAGAVPVVINAGGQKEIVENGKSGFLWSTLSELEEKTKTLMENESIWKEMSVVAEKRANFFAGDRFCREVKKIIQ